MRVQRKIVCGVLLTAVIGVGALAAWQWNNISAALSFVRFSQEELEEKLADNDQVIKDAVEANPSVTIREVTEEERAALRDGTLTQEELVQSLLQKPESTPESEPEQSQKPEVAPQTKPEQKPPETSTPTQQPQPKPEVSTQPKPEVSTQPEPEVSTQPEQSESEQKINELIAKVFVLREEFLIKLDNLMTQAKADYVALPPEDRSGSKLMRLASNYMSKGLALEKQCDAEVEAIATELNQIVREHGGDLSLPQTLYDTYVEEKSLKKAWYMAEVKKIGVG